MSLFLSTVILRNYTNVNTSRDYKRLRRLDKYYATVKAPSLSNFHRWHRGDYHQKPAGYACVAELLSTLFLNTRRHRWRQRSSPIYR